jgi:photosystem II stability/assembly factor-like uncharacterized protein
MRRRTFIASLGAAGAPPLPAFAKPGRQPKDAYIWKNAVVNGGGFVPGIIFNETKPNLIYARTDVGGRYRWQEDSRSWKQLLDWVGRDNWGYYYVVSMATDPVETNRVYAAVGAYTTDWDPNNGAVLYSDDYGDTWGIAENSPSSWNPVHGLPAGARIRSDRVNPSVLYAFAGGTFYRSTDAGATFSDTGATGLPAEGVDDFRVVLGREGHVWLAGRSDKAEIATGLWRSADGGVTWERISAIDLAIGVGFGKAGRGSRHEAKRGVIYGDIAD